MADLEVTQVSGETTDIPGLTIFKVSKVGDERGWFQEKFRMDKLVAVGLPSDFEVVQNNVSYNKEIGVTRGIHAEPWDKYVSVISGQVFAVFLDLRPGDSYGKVVITEIDPETAVYIPKGVGNAFQTTKANTYYSYLVNDYWSREKYGSYQFVNLSDPDLNINWPTPLDKAIVSERDKTHPLFKDLTVNES